MKVWNLLKIHNKDTRITSLTLNNFTQFSSISSCWVWTSECRLVSLLHYLKGFYCITKNISVILLMHHNMSWKVFVLNTSINTISSWMKGVNASYEVLSQRHSKTFRKICEHLVSAFHIIEIFDNHHLIF